MSKTQEELNQLKIEYETLNNKLKELSEDELNEVIGGNETPEQGSTKYTKCPIYISVHHARCYLTSKVQETIENQYSCSNCPKR